MQYYTSSPEWSLIHNLKIEVSTAGRFQKKAVLSCKYLSLRGRNIGTYFILAGHDRIRWGNYPTIL